ncbi:MAG: glycogen/starch synthase [Planctomycetota bacterium]|nr:glycogen/starch synthase [Planctomycetota bacterium]
MNILIASSEVVPFAKTGGLADVCGALPIELERLGHRPFVFMPGFRSVYTAGQPVEPLGVEFNIPIGSKISKGSLAKSVLPGSEVEVFIVQQPEYFERAELYREAGEDYPDNCERFVFFCRAVMESIRFLDLKVDVLHGHDWQAG